MSFQAKLNAFLREAQKDDPTLSRLCAEIEYLVEEELDDAEDGEHLGSFELEESPQLHVDDAPPATLEAAA